VACSAPPAANRGRDLALTEPERPDAPAQNGGAPTTRDRVYEAARQALAEKGLEVDIHDVIERAGVGAGTVYRHFVGKEALYREVALAMVDRTRREFLEIASRYTDARECIARTMELGFRNVRDYGQLAIELFGGVHPPEYGNLFDRRALEAFFRALIERGIRQGHFRQDVDLEHAVGVWFALTAPGVLGRLLATRPLEQVAADTTRFFLAGLSRGRRG
jgi:AcrR family transcriptional regulator